MTRATYGVRAVMSLLLSSWMAVRITAAAESAKDQHDTQALADYERTTREAAATGAKKETNAVALTKCEIIANDAEMALPGLAASTNPATLEACNGIRLVVSAIRGLAGTHARWPDAKQPTGEFCEALTYFQECAKTGKDPFAGMLSGVRPYQSPIDGDILGYEFKLPKDYTPTKKYPLEISLHCSGGFMWRGSMTGLKPTADPAQSSDTRHHGKFDATDAVEGHECPCVLMHIYGRGEANSYTSLGEAAILEAIADIRKHYSVDDTRILIGGASMGGTGGFRICTLYPDLFATAYSFTGSGTYHGPLESGLYNAYLRADNLCNTPFCVFDEPNDNNGPFLADLDALAAKYPGAYAHIELKDPAGSHGSIAGELRNKGWAWMRQQVRNPWPKRVVYKSYGLRYHSAYWTHLDMMQDAENPARIEAEVLTDGKVRVATSNLACFHLDLAGELCGKVKDVEVVIDGTTVRTASGGTVNFAQTNGAWHVAAERYPAGLVKKPGSSGPILDVFTGEPVLFVYGTQLERDPALRGKMVDTVVNTLFGKPDGGMCIHAAFPRKADVDVTAADMAVQHLVLLGTAVQNSLVARIATNLPVQFGTDGIRLGSREYKGAGVIMVYPNPLNPERYVLLMPENYARADPDPRSLHDYFIGTFGPATRVLAEGTFDSRWRLKP